jgi:type III restriction enzyme
MDLLLETGLEHQERPVELIANLFLELGINGERKYYENPVFDFASADSTATLKRRVERTQKNEGIVDYAGYDAAGDYLSLDIKMETGTGKTYVYTHVMYELFKRYGINKFIVIVPTLPIKAGTKDFISDPYVRRHFRDERGYKTDIDLCVLNASKAKKKKGRNYFPGEVRKFVEGTLHDSNRIYVLLTNMALLTSGKVLKSTKYDSGVEGFYKPFEAIAATHPFVLIDEPHKFKESGKTYQSITDNLKPQCIIRFGATFPEHSLGRGQKPVKDYHNLLYDLNAYQSFRQNLIKGVAKEHVGSEDSRIGKVKLTEFEGGKSNYAKFTLSDSNGKVKQHFTLSVGESLGQIDEAFNGISITGISKKFVTLSNGKDLNKEESFFIDTYSVSYQEQMMTLALKRHFEIEKENFERSPKIRTLALFFIEDVDSFRDHEDGTTPWLREKFEEILRQQMEHEMIRPISDEYRDYLEASLSDLHACAGGYFARDNQDTDQNIAEEVDEILNGKKKLLQFKKEDGSWNTRRFLFSKWTLKEGWDNPNVFTICKLRSSGSDISKMQEVGRGLRLPVDVTGRRVKGEDFMLNYIVDKSEASFASELVAEINGELQSGQQFGKFSLADFTELAEKRGTNVFMLLAGINEMIEQSGSFIVVKKEYMLEFLNKFPELRPKDYNSNKVQDRNKERKEPIKIRQEKFDEIAELWKKITTKYILSFQAQIGSLLEEELPGLLLFTDDIHVRSERTRIESQETGMGLVRDTGYEIPVISRHIPYGEYLRRLSNATSVPISILHKATVEYAKAHEGEDTRRWFSEYSLNQNIHIIYDWFKVNLMGKFNYTKTDFIPKDTKLTYNGKPNQTIKAGLIGVNIDKDVNPLGTYLYDTVAYDSPLEKENITNEVGIAKVTVFGKIPRSSIAIPTIASSSYSPDFMYVIEHEDGTKELNLVVETKDVDSESDLRPDESVKIACAEVLFKCMQEAGINVHYRTQIKNQKMSDIIKDIIGNRN